MGDLHDGHRQRLKARFLKEGLDSFDPHNTLEILLFYAVPRKDTNSIAHTLLNRFRTLTQVFNAPFEELCAIEGITEHAALLLKMIPQLLRVYAMDGLDGEPLDSTKKMKDYCIKSYIGATIEIVRVICLDNQLRIMADVVAFEGGVSKSEINLRKLVQIAFAHNTDTIILTHNHPLSNEIPSDSDLAVTNFLINALRSVGIKLLDHIVVGGNRATSMRDCGYFN